MTRFFFDTIENGKLTRDQSGTELPNLDAARREATRTAGEIIRCSSVHDPVQDLLMTIRDQDQFVVAQCSFGMAPGREGRE